MNTSLVYLDPYQAVGLAAVVLVFGRWITVKFPILHKYCIPAPVVGGFIFALLNLVLYSTGLGSIQFDTTFQTFFMTVFYCTVGMTASFGQLNKGGKQVVIFLLLVIFICTMQNVLGCVLAVLFGLDARLGLAMGSIPLVGGHGTSGSFGPLLESMGVSGGTTVAISSATFGLIAGSVMGGPLANLRIRKLGIPTLAAQDDSVCPLEKDAEDNDNDEISTRTYAAALEQNRRANINQERFLNATLMIAFAIGAGTLIYDFFMDLGITFPSYIGAMILACVIRNITDIKNIDIPLEEVDCIGHLSLNMYLALALMGLKLWELSSLAIAMIVILLVQCVALALFAYIPVFHAMGKDYEAACFITASCGFGMGATANAMANVAAVNKKYGPSPKALFIVPLVGALFIDFFNSLIITGFLNFLR